MKEKIRQDNLKKNNDVRYNVGIRTMCKLFMNALSGKLLQRNFDTEKTLIKSFLNYYTWAVFTQNILENKFFT